MTTQHESREQKDTESSKRPSGKMTVEEAGRRGGERTAETRGHEFYQSIGRKGGKLSAKTNSTCQPSGVRVERL